MKRFYSLLAIVLLACCCTQKSAQTEDNTAWIEGSVVYEMNVRQMTPEGSFDAATAKLPELKDLGVDVVWVMPLYPIGELERKGSLGSYYAIRNYCDVNPEFGSLQDFDEFLAEAHRLGLKVIIDWVANHTSPDHPWVTEKPAEWYVRDESGKTIVEYDWTDIAKLNYDCPEVHVEMEKVMRFWLDRGIDGFRCDVAYKVPQDFWTKAIASMRESYDRTLYFLAEGEETWLHEAGFDATYAWKEHHLLNAIAQGTQQVDSLVNYINWNAETYPKDALRLSFTSNHDENSWAGTEFERMGEAWQAMSVLAWTLPNTQPLIYTAQEIGYDHRFAFFDKDPVMEWKTNSFTDFYRYLADTKHSHPALCSTEAEFEILSTADNTIIYKRSLGNDWVKVSVQLEAPWAWSIESERDRIAHIEPPCWWTGIKTPLQIMV
ncbi:MAG: alpha-amylase, partial [Bacteroidales bacterium]|nr:alpha-amylase [Bacteroidales bacterium]